MQAHTYTHTVFYQPFSRWIWVASCPPPLLSFPICWTVRTEHPVGTRQNFSPFHQVLLRSPVCLVSSVFIKYLTQSVSSLRSSFYMFSSQPSQSTLLNHQCDWFQSKQFSELCIFLLFCQFKATYIYLSTLISVLSNASILVLQFQYISLNYL